ncbi:MAG: site-2 protease family protein [Clostridia bacterium]|nr:site-2 protease family protein [Clostridia bacterium]
MNTILYLLLTLLLLSIMVVIHELGHFLFAKLFKVTVLEFSIGMGPAIYTTKKKKNENKSNGSIDIAGSFRKGEDDDDPILNKDAISDVSAEQKTDFSIRALPIGGYVSMAGEDDASDDANAFCNKPVWQRFIITVAGAVMNILLGILCMCLLVGIETNQYSQNGEGHLVSNTIYGFQENSTSDKCENPLMAGDTVIKVNGVYVHTGNELVYEIMNQGYKPLDLVVLRNGQRTLLEDVVFPTEENTGTTFGNYDFIMQLEKADFLTIVKHSFFRSISTVKVITDSLGDLIGGRYGAEAVSGPIGMAGAVGEATKSGFSSILYLFILITMNLGVFNLLPLPALDGGRLIFLIIEGIARKPVKREIEQTINTVGIMMLMALMLLITVKDVFSLF